MHTVDCVCTLEFIKDSVYIVMSCFDKIGSLVPNCIYGGSREFVTASKMFYRVYRCRYLEYECDAVDKNKSSTKFKFGNIYHVERLYRKGRYLK